MLNSTGTQLTLDPFSQGVIVNYVLVISWFVLLLTMLLCVKLVLLLDLVVCVQNHIVTSLSIGFMLSDPPIVQKDKLIYLLTFRAPP